MPALRRAPAASLLPFLVSGLVVACGSPPPPQPPAAAPVAPVATEPREKAPDTSPVPEPAGLVMVGRITKPEAIVGTVATWTRLPLPSGSELVRTIVEEPLADVVDLSQPIDAAVTVALSRHGVEPLVAFSVAVKGYDQAKAKLGASHPLVVKDNGMYRITGLSLGPSKSRAPRLRAGGQEPNDDDLDEDAEGCVLAPSAQGGRLVCGEGAAIEALAPYLSRTMPREKWSSDVHLEVRPEPVRAPLQELRSSIPIMARNLLGTQSAALRDLVDSSIGELLDVVGDAQKLTVDAQIADTGIVASTRFEFQTNKSLFARAVTADRGEAPPPSFWHLPAETDTAFFGRGSDPKLFEHPRELLANLMMEAADSEGMPEPERRALKELIVDRMLALFTAGSGVYGKGYDAAAVDKAMSNLSALKADDRAKRSDGELALLEQVVGWHLYQVSEPVAKVGPILKDWSALWNRPAFAKWVQAKARDKKTLPRMRVVGAPPGVTLPKETVHLEITIPREDIRPEPAVFDPVGRKAPPKKAAAKATPRKPVVVHLFAVPDGAATWLAFGLDAKLVAQKAAASLASAPDAGTLGKVTGNEALREGRINSGGFATLRGVMVLSALDSHGDRSPFKLVGTLPSKGATPMIFTGKAETPSAGAKAGASVGSLRISRAVIEDMVKLAMAAK